MSPSVEEKLSPLTASLSFIAIIVNDPLPQLKTSIDDGSAYMLLSLTTFSHQNNKEKPFQVANVYAAKLTGPATEN